MLKKIEIKCEKEVCKEPDQTSVGDRCEKCRYYLFIDSGYGYCRRFPPKTENRKIKYQVVEWCRIKCGEFEEYKNKNKR